MLEGKKEQPVRVVPKDLPLPQYDYQKPATGSFTVKFDEGRQKDQRAEGDKAPLASLQNIQIAF